MDEMEALHAATRRYRRWETARQEAIDAVLAALRAGERPTDVEAASPFTGAYIRRLARDAGIEPRKKGDRPPRSK